MCLLFYKPANTTNAFTNDQLADMYRQNSDGYGVMFAEDGQLHYEKAIGSVTQWITFFRRHEHREACFHLRMRTHGDVDLTNCHPYPVYEFDDLPKTGLPVLMMHNGVLSTGNKADTSKSDTWHYIRDYIHPITKNDPDAIFTSAFKAMVSSHIGSSNKFALMDSNGRVQIINRSSGIEYNDCWFSNTYAWSAHSEKLYPGILDVVYGKSRYSGGYRGWYPTRDDMFDGDGFDTTTGSTVSTWQKDPYRWEQGKVWDNKIKGYVWPEKKTTSTPALPAPIKTVTKPSAKQQKLNKIRSKKAKGKTVEQVVLEDANGNKMKTTATSTWLPPGLRTPQEDIAAGMSDDVRYILKMLKDHTVIHNEVSETMVNGMIDYYGASLIVSLVEDVITDPDNAPTQTELLEMFLDPNEAEPYFQKLLDAQEDALDREFNQRYNEVE